MDITTATPFEIDTPLAAIYNRYYDKRAAAAAQARTIRAGRKDLIKIADRPNNYYGEGATERVQAEIDAAEAKRVALEAEADEILTEATPYQTEFARRGGWARFFLVQDGHIHRSNSPAGCRTLRATTRIGWLPDLSGKTEADAIAYFEREGKGRSEVLCSVCYPDAPVAWTTAQTPTDQCPGSGTWDYPEDTARLRRYSGNFGVCEHCKQPITVSSTGKMRKHKRQA